MIQYSGKGDTLFYEPICKVWFKSSPMAVLEGEYNFNRGLATNTCLGNLEYLYLFFNLDAPEESKEIGWNYDYLALEWCSVWVDFIHVPRITDQGVPYIEINYPMEPKPMDYLEGRFD